MFDEDSYHAAMLFVKQLEADLQGCDRGAWARHELNPNPNANRAIKRQPKFLPPDRFEEFMEARNRLNIAA